MQKNEEIFAPSNTVSSTCKGTLVLDPCRFHPYLAEADYSKEQEEALLQSIWQIIVGFVELGFDIQETCNADVGASVEIDLCAYLAGDTAATDCDLKSKFDVKNNATLEE